MTQEHLPEAPDIRRRREVDRAVVVLALEPPLRAAWYWLINFIDAWIGGPGTATPVLRVVVADQATGTVVWTNHGYRPADDPEGAFDALCEEIDYFTLDGFLRRRKPGYWRGNRPWRGI